MTKTKTPTVLLDCDTGIDDALALILLAALHRAGRITLAGVTTTAGNTTAEQAARNTRWILGLAGIGEEVPVVAGEAGPVVVDLVTTPETHGPTGLGYAQAPAAEVGYDWQGLWREVLQDDGDALLVVTGPATNAAVWSRANALPKHITLMGGAYLYPGNTTPTAEWNSWVDPHAAKELFGAVTRPITVCALGVTEQMLLTPTLLEESVAALGDCALAKVLEPMLRFYFEFHQAQGEGYLAQVHDLLAVMIALGIVDVEAHTLRVDVEADSALLRGTTVADFKGHWNQPANARLITQANVAQAWDVWRKALGLLRAFHSAS